TYGLFNGIGLAVAMAYLGCRLPRTTDQPRTRPWTEVVAVAVVVLAITYVNLVQNVSQLGQSYALPREMYGLSSKTWFEFGYGLLAVVVVALLVRHLYRRLAFIPENWLGKGQLLYLVFLWWMVIGNLMRAIPPFQEVRLITEGVIHVNA